MISEELSKIIEKINAQGKMRFLEAATEEQLNEFERKNNIIFPNQYRQWLLFSDGGECFLPAGVQFYGVNHKPIIDVNNNDRPDNTYVVIGALASGDPILIKKETETICIYNQENERIESDEIYKDFFTFVLDLYSILGIGE